MPIWIISYPGWVGVERAAVYARIKVIKGARRSRPSAEELQELIALIREYYEKQTKQRCPI